MKRFDRGQLEAALRMMGELAHDEGRTIEIAIYGGSALMLTFDWRAATRDVDAVFETDRSTIRRLSGVVADRLDMDTDWINDGVKGFLSAADRDPGSRRLFATYPSEAQPGLRVMVASPEYLFAMKCRAMRVGGVDSNSDIEDIAGLAQELGIETAEQAFEIIAGFYPAQVIEPKTQFGLEEIFERMLAERNRRNAGGR